MEKYKEKKAWRRIQSFLPKENQIRGKFCPKEEKLRYRKFLLHIDVYPVDGKSSPGSDKTPKGTVVIFHGVGGNGRLLEFIALPLWRAGYEVICPDLPLYGLTEYTGTVSWDDWVRCGVRVCMHYGGSERPLYVMGLSAGGMLAYQVAEELPSVSGLMVTCLLDQRIREVTLKTASDPLTALLGKPFLFCTHWIFGGVKIPMRAVCKMKDIVNNEELARILMADRRSAGADVCLEFLYTMLNPKIRTEPWHFTKCPVLLVHPGDDHWTDPACSRRFFDRIAAKKEFYLLEGAGHFPIEKKGLEEFKTYCLRFMEENPGKGCKRC